MYPRGTLSCRPYLAPAAGSAAQSESPRTDTVYRPRIPRRALRYFHCNQPASKAVRALYTGLLTHLLCHSTYIPPVTRRHEGQPRRPVTSRVFGGITNWSGFGDDDGEIVFVGARLAPAPALASAHVDVKDSCKYAQGADGTRCHQRCGGQSLAIGYASLSAVGDHRSRL